MIPIQNLLHRILWDPEFGRGEFEIGYEDHLAGRVVRVPFRRVRLEPGEHFAFQSVEDDGSIHSVPFHRVREVWRDGKSIWRRPPKGRV